MSADAPPWGSLLLIGHRESCSSTLFLRELCSSFCQHARHLASRCTCHARKWRYSDKQCVSESCTSMAPTTQYFFSSMAREYCTYSTTEHGMVAMTWSAHFLREYILNNFDVSRQLAERREACLVCRLPRPRERWLAGWGEAFSLSDGRASVHLVLDCQKYYCSTIIIVRLPEEAKSQAQGHLLTLG